MLSADAAAAAADDLSKLRFCSHCSDVSESSSGTEARASPMLSDISRNALVSSPSHDDDEDEESTDEAAQLPPPLLANDLSVTTGSCFTSTLVVALLPLLLIPDGDRFPFASRCRSQ